MPADAFVTKLNEQVANEFAAHQQYVACAVLLRGSDHAAAGLASSSARRSRSATTR